MKCECGRLYESERARVDCARSDHQPEKICAGCGQVGLQVGAGGCSECARDELEGLDGLFDDCTCDGVTECRPCRGMFLEAGGFVWVGTIHLVPPEDTK